MVGRHDDDDSDGAPARGSGGGGHNSSGYVRYAQLPADVRDWLERLRPEDVFLLTKEQQVQAREAISYMQTLKTLGRFGRWAIAGGVAVFLAIGPIFDTVGKLKMWLMGGK